MGKLVNRSYEQEGIYKDDNTNWLENMFESLVLFMGLCIFMMSVLYIMKAIIFGLCFSFVGSNMFYKIAEDIIAP